MTSKITLVLFVSWLFLFSLLVSILLIVNSTITTPAPHASNQSEYATGYIVRKGEKEVGLLLGSFHTQLNYDEQDRFKTMFLREAKKNNRTVFTEIPTEAIPAGGVEASLVHAVHFDKSVKKQSFESLQTQLAFLNRSVFVGEKVLHLPLSYQFMSNHPLISLYTCKMTQSYALLYNILYNVFMENAHAQFLISRAGAPDRVAKLYRAYQGGTIRNGLSNEERDIFCMQERDALYADTLASQSEDWLAVIGSQHLTGEQGLVELLKEKGFSLEPVNTYKMAMGPDTQ